LKIIARLKCLVLGHMWSTFRINASKHVALARFHPLAGMDAKCARCGKTWLDAEDPYFTEEPSS
jgi:hypothetical protein